MSNQREVIARMLEQYKEAISNRDLAAFVGLYDVNVQIFDDSFDCSYGGLERWRDATEIWFESLWEDRLLVRSDAMHIVASSTLGAANGLMIYTTVTAAGIEVQSVRRRFTWTVERDSVGWKVVHEHTSRPVQLASRPSNGLRHGAI